MQIRIEVTTGENKTGKKKSRKRKRKIKRIYASRVNTQPKGQTCMFIQACVSDLSLFYVQCTGSVTSGQTLF